MSHFTQVKTRFQNLVHLKKALHRLEIIFEEKHSTKSAVINLIIPQANGHDIEFSWNDQEYSLIADLSYWEQPSTVESFVDKIAQCYAGEVILEESQKMGFQVVTYDQIIHESNTLILDRWNS